MLLEASDAMPVPLTWAAKPEIKHVPSISEGAAVDPLNARWSKHRRQFLATLVSDICQKSTNQGVGQMADEHGFALILIREYECNAKLLAMIWKDQRIQVAGMANALSMALRAVYKTVQTRTLIYPCISDTLTAEMSISILI